VCVCVCVRERGHGLAMPLFLSLSCSHARFFLCSCSLLIHSLSLISISLTHTDSGGLSEADAGATDIHRWTGYFRERGSLILSLSLSSPLLSETLLSFLSPPLILCLTHTQTHLLDLSFLLYISLSHISSHSLTLSLDPSRSLSFSFHLSLGHPYHRRSPHYIPSAAARTAPICGLACARVLT
jgi:hypothetical protein